MDIVIISNDKNEENGQKLYSKLDNTVKRLKESFNFKILNVDIPKSFFIGLATLYFTIRLSIESYNK